MPDTPPLVDAEPLTGHLWVQELPTGGQFRFQVANSGRLTFCTADRTFDTVKAVPLSHRRTAMTVSERLNRGALRTALDDPTQITFFGTATRNEGISYDWTALPPFVGIDAWVTRQTVRESGSTTLDPTGTRLGETPGDRQSRHPQEQPRRARLHPQGGRP